MYPAEETVAAPEELAADGPRKCMGVYNENMLQLH